MSPREMRLRARIDVLSDRIEALEQALAVEQRRHRNALYAMRHSRDLWRHRALRR